MQTIITPTFLGLGLLLALAAPPLTQAGPLKEANVTQIVKEVNLLPEQAAPRPAAVNDKVSEKTAVRTGVESRSELTFPDRTLTRLGPQTIFSFREGNRTFNVGGDGSILLNVPKNSGGAKINSAAVTAAITGTTVVLETHNFPKDTGYHPDSDYKGAWFKFLVLEGEARFCRRNHTGDCVIVHQGEMLVGRADEPLGHPVPFDINQFVLSYVLTTGLPLPLPADVLALIAAAANQQQGPLANALIASINPTPPGEGPGLVSSGITVGNVQTINNTLGTINPSNVGAQVVTPEQNGPP
jgi:FecR protein